MLRAGLLYAGAAWALSQGVSQLSPALNLPDYVTRWFLIACAIGFPFWVAFAWFYEFTPQGFKRESEIAADAPVRQFNARRLDFAIIGMLAVLVVLLGSGYFVRRAAPVPEAAHASAFSPPAASIVVLPFRNLSGDPKQQYFSDGITEELTDAIGQNPDLTVIAWDTASKFRDTRQTAGEMGRTLNVAHVLDGSIQRAGAQVRVSAELVSTVSGRQLWAAHYDDSTQNIFAVQDKISAAIADALKVKFAGMQAAPTLNPQAHELYLRGLATTDRQTAAAAQAGLEDFRAALQLDPGYADAWAGLAGAYLGLVQWSTLPLHDALPKMREAAQKALSLDPHNVNALVQLANADAIENRVAKAKVEYQQALKVDPNNARAHLDYGTVLPLEQSLAETREAARLDPDNVTAQNNLATDAQDAHDWPQMMAAAKAMIGLSPHEIDGAFYLASAYTQMRRGKDAVKAFDLVQPATALDRQLVDAGRLTYQSLLQPVLRPKALEALDALRRAHVSPYSQGDLLQLYLALDEKATAMQMLPGMCAAQPIGCNDLAINPLYAPLHGDPHFDALSQQYGTMASE